jgi:tRNA modification GTPase
MGDGSTALIIRDRHRAAILEARGLMHSALEEKSLELVAEDLRLAARSLARIIGTVDTEDLLDLVFSRFCIGK